MKNLISLIFSFTFARDDLELDNVKIEHERPTCLRDWLAFVTIQTMRFNFDVFTGFKFGELTKEKWLTRCIFLESVAGGIHAVLDDRMKSYILL